MHSPGPWYRDGRKDDQMGSAIIRDATGFECANARSWLVEHSESNANLIAAAPTLLEALSLIATQNVDKFGAWEAFTRYAQETARAAIAIAKAEATHLVRPVACGLCGQPMFYVRDPRHVPEVYITVDGGGPTGIYAHASCWKEGADIGAIQKADAFNGWQIGGQMTGPTTVALHGATVQEQLFWNMNPDADGIPTELASMYITQGKATVAIIPACKDQKAIAQLLVAAPALLESLKQVLERAVDDYYCSHDNDGVLANARDAIAKAEGG